MPERPSISRRSFIKLAATAGAAAAIPGCEPAARKLIPYVVPDENVVPGVPSFFATTCARMPGRMRRGRANPRRARHQARGKSRRPDRPGRHMRARSGRAARTVQSRPAGASASARRRRRVANGVVGRSEKMLGDQLAAASKAGKDRVAFFGVAEWADLRKDRAGVSRQLQFVDARYSTKQSTMSPRASRRRPCSAGAICRSIESIRPKC